MIKETGQYEVGGLPNGLWPYLKWGILTKASVSSCWGFYSIAILLIFSLPYFHPRTFPCLNTPRDELAHWSSPLNTLVSPPPLPRLLCTVSLGALPLVIHSLLSAVGDLYIISKIISEERRKWNQSSNSQIILTGGKLKLAEESLNDAGRIRFKSKYVFIKEKCE